MTELKYTEQELMKYIFKYKGDPPFCFKMVYCMIRDCIAFINKLGLKGEFLLECDNFDREDFEMLFLFEKQNPNKVTKIKVLEKMKEMGF